jgi:hypothetical protein
MGCFLRCDVARARLNIVRAVGQHGKGLSVSAVPLCLQAGAAEGELRTRKPGDGISVLGGIHIQCVTIGAVYGAGVMVCDSNENN